MTFEYYEPMTVRCPACNSGPNERCTQATETSRKEVGWIHYAREWVKRNDTDRRMFLTFDRHGQCTYREGKEQCAFNSTIHGTNYHLISGQRVMM